MAEKQSGAEHISQIAQRIFIKSIQHNIKLTPKAYHVWFEYFMGNNEDLRHEIECVDESYENLTDNVMESIYNRYIIDEFENGITEKVNQKTQKILDDVFSDLLAADKITSNYGDRLDGYTEKLGVATKIGQVQAIVKGLIQDTHKMSETSSSLQKRLEQANQQARELKERLKEAEESAYTDALTNIHNRKAFDRKIKSLMDQFRETGTMFSYIIFDIDFFKRFNDTYGHQAGDMVLQVVGAILRMSLKGMDFPARYGGEEFVILLPETDIKDAIIVAEKLRIRIASKNLRQLKIHQSDEKITASFGVSQLEPDDTLKTVMERADKALYYAKEEGRNNVKSQLDHSAMAPTGTK